jgi:outer membrane receptor protein involved in Fe transport
MRKQSRKYAPCALYHGAHKAGGGMPLPRGRRSGNAPSARGLAYADGYLLSTLIGNNNSGASPRWALVAAEEIERIDVIYGPFSAAYPGNSMGAVVEIPTRMPQTFEAGAKILGAWQDCGATLGAGSHASSNGDPVLNAVEPLKAFPGHCRRSPKPSA